MANMIAPPRCAALIGPYLSGKTTLLEALLHDSGSTGRRIGLSANEGGDLTPDASHVLDAGDIYALHVGTRDGQGGAIASAMVAITPRGCEVLLRGL